MVCCAILLFGLLVSKPFVFSSKSISVENTLDTGIINKAIQQHNKDAFYASLNFANEALPRGEKKVEAMILKVLREFSYSRQGSHKFHHLSRKWFKVIEPILKKHGIPDDFKYLPLVESGFAFGVSHKGAAGYWQFMPNTAREFGLLVNDQVDERENLVKSTEAAALYLKSLYRQFGSWTLTAAAYNVGEGSLRRSIRSQKQKNYYRLALNSETAVYLYKIISMKEIIENPSRYGYRESPETLLASQSVEDANFPKFESTAPSMYF